MQKSTRVSARSISIGKPITGGESIIMAAVHETNKYGNFASTGDPTSCDYNTVASRIIRSTSIILFPIAYIFLALSCKLSLQYQAVQWKNILCTFAKNRENYTADIIAVIDVIEKIIAHDCNIAIISISICSMHRCRYICLFYAPNYAIIYKLRSLSHDYFSSTEM